MYIEPDTIIRILRDVPLDNTYEHTIYFGNSTQQISYFTNKTKFTLDRQSYQRVQRGWMRINIEAEQLYDCNYIMFQNHAFGTKWFYAFIKSVEYVNHSVSQIEFEIDVMQTWAFQYTLDDCFVERQHTETDVLFANTVPENLEIGNTVVCNGNAYQYDLNDVTWVLTYAQRNTGGEEQPWQPTDAQPVRGSVSAYWSVNGDATRYGRYDDPVSLSALADAVKNELEIFKGHEDAIVALYLFPANFVDNQLMAAPTEKIISFKLNTVSIDGYVPKNKKLFCYPYNYLLVSNNDGQTATYKLENWGAAKGGAVPGNPFSIIGTPAPQPNIFVYPRDYRGLSADYESGLLLSNFPTIPWTGDRAAQWWEQNKNQVQVQNLVSVLSAGLSTASVPVMGLVGGPVTTAYSAISAGRSMLNAYSQIAEVNAKKQDLENTPPQLYGQSNQPTFTQATGRLRFTFYNMTIKAEYARIVDDYFSRFGYAIHRIQKPNMHARPHWTYLKTGACTITGSLPCDDANTICRIYDNGITFWVNGDEVGDYSLDNSPTEG